MANETGTQTLPDSEKVEQIAIESLLLDLNNPRFGELAQDRRNQTELLDFIVKTFGVNDLLSSLAVNGYFAAEPVVCRRTDDGLVVTEGNRRLAACLILAGDERAKNQQGLIRKYQAIHERHGNPPIQAIPAIVFDDEQDKKALLSYLGVRHIAASKSWDSYAKAVWVSRVISEAGVPLDDVAAMIGDEHRALARLLEGYHFVRQLEQASRFRPEDSNRRGRGSNTLYPFSWIYTFLGYSTARRFLGLQDNKPENPEPVPRARIDDAALVTKAMFGNRSEGASPAINDSRQISKLALALESPEKVELLRQGKTIDEIEESTRPISDALRSTLVSVRELLSALSGRMDSEPPDLQTANEFKMLARQVKNLANAIEEKLRKASGDDGE